MLLYIEISVVEHFFYFRHRKLGVFKCSVHKYASHWHLSPKSQKVDSTIGRGAAILWPLLSYHLSLRSLSIFEWPVFFFLLFLGPKFGPLPLAKKYVFFPLFWKKIPLKMKYSQKKIGKMCRQRVGSVYKFVPCISHAVNLRVASLGDR